jgi:membrane protein DedA with SNARE-associated domain
MKKIILLLSVILLAGCAPAKTTAEANENSATTNEQTVKPAPEEDAGFVARIGSWYTNNLNYFNVTALMALESSFVPFPSEIVVPPAAYAACNDDSPMAVTDSHFLNVLFVILFATLGALIGALINYALSYFLGRPFIYWFADSKVGHLCLINREKVEKAEAYFVEHGNASTLIGRLVPVIRQLISIPAGLSKMNIFAFVGYTTLGAFVWNVILAVLGYVAHGQQDLITQYSHELSWVLLALGALFVAYLVYKGLKNRKKNNKKDSDEA